jgi:hypothetical protein
MIREDFTKTEHPYRKIKNVDKGFTEIVIARFYSQMSPDSFEVDLPKSYSLHLNIKSAKDFKSLPIGWHDIPDYRPYGNSLMTLSKVFVNPKTLEALTKSEDKMIFIASS